MRWASDMKRFGKEKVIQERIYVHNASDLVQILGIDMLMFKQPYTTE